jgi:hypothetical protein
MIAVVLVIGHDTAVSGAMLTGASQMAAGVVAGLVIGVVAALRRSRRRIADSDDNSVVRRGY